MLVSSSPQVSFAISRQNASLESSREPLKFARSEDLENSPTSTPSTDNEDSKVDAVAEQRELQKLKNRDREVRAHELAHVAVGSRYVTSGAQFTYEKGPDGRLYAVAGEVSIDTSAVPGDPRATLTKSQIVARAALAPANPSVQDRQVAAQAAALALQARAEIAIESAKDGEENEKGSTIDAFA